MISKLLKFGIFSAFFGMITWIGIHLISIIGIFPDYHILELGVSCVLFIVVIAIKRGVWH